MKIVINALFLRTKVAGGTETYVTNIVRPWYLEEVEGVSFLFIANHIPEWWEGDQAWFKLRVVKTRGAILGRIFYEQVILPGLDLDGDVLFSPGYVGVLGAKCPQVITVHDAFAWIVPKEAGRWRTLYWRRMIAWSVKYAAGVIAVSASTRNDLLKFTNVDAERLHLIAEAGDHVPGPNSDPDSERARDVRGYFIAVGFFKEIKNPSRILAAYARYRTTMSERGNEPCGFKLIGAIFGAEAEKIRQQALQITGIEALGRIDDAELYQLIREANGFIFASLYEGFGLPILEAQRLGCPVLTSRISSMPEVAGAGALLVDPLNVESIHDGMVELNSPERRAELVRRGRENERRFSWRRASASTLELLRSVARRHREPNPAPLDNK